MSIRVRMYRTGFGDCFLLSLANRGTSSHLLIDFGVHPGGDIGTLSEVMTDIENETDRRLELIVATHAHRDHISGFAACSQRFAEFHIGEIWLPWTEDPSDERATNLRRREIALSSALESHLKVLQGRSGDNLHGDALQALMNLSGNVKAIKALTSGFGTGARVLYHRSGHSVTKVGTLSGVTIDVLGPTDDERFLAKLEPPSSQRYIAAISSYPDGFHPFEREFELLSGDEVLEEQPVLSPEDEELLNNIAQGNIDSLALSLDTARNNTSLVLLIQFAGKSLIFPGDAQWGSWQAIFEDDDYRKALEEIDFMKISHHGSQNATPRVLVENLNGRSIPVMLSTHEAPFSAIPSAHVVAAVSAIALGNVVLRSDYVPVEAAYNEVPPRLPSNCRIGKYWIDCYLE